MSQKIDCVSFSNKFHSIAINKDDNFGKLLKKAAKEFKLPQSLVGIFPLQSNSMKLPSDQWEPALLKWKKSDNLQKLNGVGLFVYDEGNISALEKALLERLERRFEVLSKLEAARAAEAKKNAKLGIKPAAPVQENKPQPKKEIQKQAEPQQQIAKQKSNEAQKVKKNNSQEKQLLRQKSQEKAKRNSSFGKEGGFTIEEPVFPSQIESSKAKKNASFSKEVQQNVQRQKSQEKAKRNSSFGKDEQPALSRQRSKENNRAQRNNSAGINVPQAIGNPELTSFLERLQTRQDELEKRFEKFFESLQSKLDGLQSKQEAFLGDLQANQKEQQKKLERFLQSA